MSIKVPDYKKKLIYKFTCPHCGTGGEFDPETKGKTAVRGAGEWQLLSRIPIMQKNGVEVKLRELACLRCGMMFVKYHEDTPKPIADRNRAMKMTPDHRQVIAYKEITTAEMNRRTGYAPRQEEEEDEVQPEEETGGTESAAGTEETAGRGNDNDDNVGRKGRKTLRKGRGNVPD